MKKHFPYIFGGLPLHHPSLLTRATYPQSFQQELMTLTKTQDFTCDGPLALLYFQFLEAVSMKNRQVLQLMICS